MHTYGPGVGEEHVRPLGLSASECCPQKNHGRWFPSKVCGRNRHVLGGTVEGLLGYGLAFPNSKHPLRQDLLSLKPQQRGLVDTHKCGSLH